MASDAGLDDRMPGNPTSNFGFEWVSSSPTPAEVEKLEACFPDAVQIPVAELEEEAREWKERALLMRTFHRWVPAEAYLREFRRGGIAGDILPISLSFRCHIFKFMDVRARDEVLKRPWIINGQPVAAEAWRPEFIPAKDAVTTALLWIRLPNLPIEFWKDEFLRLIIEPAGRFVCADAATVARNRAGYARVCAEIELRSPLRPGTRVKGLCSSFWQPFIFEQLDGICPRCASLHLSGVCSAEMEAESETSPEAIRYGSWLSAVRRRRAAPGARDGGQAKKPSSQHAKSSASKSPASMDCGLKQDADGWSPPPHLVRRRRVRRSSDAGGQKPVVGQASTGETSADSREGRSVVTVHRAALKLKQKVMVSGVSETQNPESECSEGLQLNNPFASLDVDSGGTSSMGIAEGTLGP